MIFPMNMRAQDFLDFSGISTGKEDENRVSKIFRERIQTQGEKWVSKIM
jgi:hypothetical protein